MAKLTSLIEFTGSLGNLSAYKRKDIDKPIIRTKGGASKEQIKTAPAFENTRRINKEFGMRAKASGYVMDAMYYLKRLADYNIAGPLNALIRPIQLEDKINDWGERDIRFTQRTKLLQGFSLNKKNPFDSIIRSPLSFEVSKEKFSAQVSFPELKPKINLFIPEPFKQPFYRFAIMYGLVPDIRFEDKQYKLFDGAVKALAVSEWFPVSTGSNEFKLDITVKPKAIQEQDYPFYSHMVSIGIEFGYPIGDNKVESSPYVGAAKIAVMV
jgi:hypothetical protein